MSRIARWLHSESVSLDRSSRTKTCNNEVAKNMKKNSLRSGICSLIALLALFNGGCGAGVDEPLDQEGAAVSPAGSADDDGDGLADDADDDADDADDDAGDDADDAADDADDAADDADDAADDADDADDDDGAGGAEGEEEEEEDDLP